MGIISGLGSFRGQFGDHFGVGIISGPVHFPSVPGFWCTPGLSTGPTLVRVVHFSSS